MSEMQPFSGVSHLSSEGFERLLRRASLNLRLAPTGSQSGAPSGSCSSAPIGSEPIGATAGALWQILSEEGPATFASLMQDIALPESLFYMAIGWLAREGKLEFEKHNGDYLIRLT